MQQTAFVSDIHRRARVTKGLEQFGQLLRARFVCSSRNADEEIPACFTHVAAVDSSRGFNRHESKKEIGERVAHAFYFAAPAGRTGLREHGATISEYRRVFNES